MVSVRPLPPAPRSHRRAVLRRDGIESSRPRLYLPRRTGGRSRLDSAGGSVMTATVTATDCRWFHTIDAEIVTLGHGLMKQAVG
jgi:hypothetical protein